MQLLIVVLIVIGVIYALSGREYLMRGRLGRVGEVTEEDGVRSVPVDRLAETAKEGEEEGELDSRGIRVE